MGKTRIVLHKFLNQSLHIGNIIVWPELNGQPAASVLLRRAHPQVQISPIGVWVQHGPKLPPL
jgi:hypothetical protein